MNFLKKLLGRSVENQQERAASRTVDMRTDRQKQIIADVHSGNVSNIVENAVEALLNIDRQYVLSANFMKVADRRCTSCGDRIVVHENVYTCTGCGRTADLKDYDSDYRHKKVVEIGEALSKAGGLELMQQVAYRFRAKGGRAGTLSCVWNHVGDWLD